MRSRLPSTQALLAFEATARYLSFRGAAESLNLTHGAIAHQVHLMEAQLGIRLVERRGRNIVLTASAQTLVIAVREALRSLDQALTNATGKGASQRTAVAVSVLPAIATRWLLHRLPDFEARHPDVDLFIKATSELVVPGRDGVIAALRYGKGRYPGLASERLASEWLFPVVSPRFNGGRLPKSLADVPKARLLRNARQPWAPWLRAAGLKAVEPTVGPVFEDASLVLQAAAEGHGIALARSLLVRSDLREMRLIRVGDVAVEDEFSYWLVWSPAASSKQMEAISALLNWLKTMLAADAQAT